MAAVEQKAKVWDIFCRVIDNYGDIGVCWRLAKQLANEHSIYVRLWLDELPALQRIEPRAQFTAMQEIDGIQVALWNDQLSISSLGDVVIEAFACTIPDSVHSLLIKAKKESKQPIWINLEYLSAEDWVDGCHKMVSIEPSSGLKKVFFFPGFTDKTGGLLCEAKVFEQRARFIDQINERESFLASLGVNPADFGENLVISLFSYENPALSSLLEAWTESRLPVLCLVPEGRSVTSIHSSLGADLKTGDVFKLGNLSIQIIPFVEQSQYDKLLWACDVNFVRGEDSFVRAQWAQKPFIWHIYPQDEDAHLVKLEAFIEKYAICLTSAQYDAVKSLWMAWNTKSDIKSEWNQYVKECIESKISHETWVKHLNSLGDLAGNMVQFCQKPL